MEQPASRREFLKIAGGVAAGLGLGGVVTVRPASATPAEMQEAIRSVIGPARVTPGKVKIELPPLIENGNAVPLTITVDSPMTEAEHVRAVHVFTEKNPQPYVATFYLGPRAGRARVSTRMRLADSQNVVAVCQLSDGSLWSDSAAIVVTLAACLEDGI